MKKRLWKNIATLIMVSANMSLTSCQKEINDYLIGTWNELQVSTTINDKTTTQKLHGTYTFESEKKSANKGRLSHTYKRGTTVNSEYGIWELYPTTGSLWLTYDGQETNVLHIDQIDDHSMTWSDYEKNQMNELITYTYKLSR